MRPLLVLFPGRSEGEIYRIVNAYLTAVSLEISKKTATPLLNKPVVFRAFMALFKSVAQRVVDKFGSDYSSANFQVVVGPLFQNMQVKKLEKPGTSWAALRDYFEKRLAAKLTL
jgi:hypothetical protein